MGGGASSSEDDGDEGWRAAIESAASIGDGLNATRAADPKLQNYDKAGDENPDESRKTSGGGRNLKLYQIKAQRMLDEMLDKDLELVRMPSPPLLDDSCSSGSVRIFREAPPGMADDHEDAHPRHMKRPRIIPGREIDEKSKKYRRQLQSVAVDGSDIIIAAQAQCQRSIARYEAKDVAAKLAAEREAQRVAELKRVRGEKWLPSWLGR